MGEGDEAAYKKTRDEREERYWARQIELARKANNFARNAIRVAIVTAAMSLAGLVGLLVTVAITRTAAIAATAQSKTAQESFEAMDRP